MGLFQLPLVALYALSAYVYSNSRTAVKMSSSGASPAQNWLTWTYLLPVAILLVGALWIYLHANDNRNISIFLQYIANARIAYFVLSAFTNTRSAQKAG